MTTPHATAADRVVPFKMAHLVYRCARRAETVAWYMAVFQAKLVFEDNVLTFITYDDEHHRLAFFNMPGIPDKQSEAAGVHHVAYSYQSVGELLRTYQRLKEGGIRPVWCINHGPTTSLYYRDPEGNDIELQVDNYPDPADCAHFFHTETFASNPMGIEFDPDGLVAMWEAGASDAELCALGAARAAEQKGPQ
ncbi:putative biphenyl-2,3-diol 1,2-dioxygenase III [Cupriavidus sp. TA19]|uniref:VOC family protein n=1 Tax=unclassified Cupriavidus TaxID=2640874 RepID=UPI000E2F7C3F|nr:MULTISPECIES: VOC family protein [unclassified Cupriavidus]BDB28688.1 VOC family protein [Cupriavidus sp. P-10]GLC94352.1 putative biphenyl-2,3-diol 1,2-dioxygenase III [Cupriavidus sp. TA19]